MVELPALDLQVRSGEQPLEGLQELLTAIFLHGLAGSGAEWNVMQERVPAEAPDLPPHGTRAEYVAAAVAAIGDRRVLLIGQSLGGHTGMLVAARHPTLVERLIVIEASPARDAGAPERVRAFFTAQPDAYGSAVDPARAAATVQELAARDWWDEWRAIRCPILVVRGARGALSAVDADRMQEENPNARSVVVAGAGHDVHLDRPDALADAIQAWTPSTSAT